MDLEDGGLEPAGELRALAEAVAEGVVLCRAGEVAWASPRTSGLLGRAPGQSLVGEHPDDWLVDLGDGLPAAGAPAAVTCGVRGREAGCTRLRVRRCALGAGEELWVLGDETRAVRAEAEVMALGQRLERVNRECIALREELTRQARDREELIGIVSHELRTPLTVIAGYTRLLLSGEGGELDDTQRHYLEETDVHCRRLDAFIGRLLDAAYDGAAQDAIDCRHASLEPVVGGIARLLRPLLDERDLRLEVELAPGARHACFDATRIEQVLTNLLGNAIKYTKPGGRIRLWSEPLSAAGQEFVQISVADQGPGIAHADRDRIFEPWVRASDAGDRGAGAAGLGLGLAICKRLVEAHGGCITVYDEPAGGSRFVFTLPAPDPPRPGETD